MNCRVYRSDPDAAVAPRRYGLDPLLPTRGHLNKAATKAMPVNRVGDFGLAPGISGRFTLFQTVDSSTIFACAMNDITLLCILLLIGAVGKSAQIGSHTRLPDAMEGPTPVSALIHVATIVTSGVFMIARCSPLFEYPPTALTVITSAGAMTSFLAATTGIIQNDPKRVIAYSTCSQLGYMIFVCGISDDSVGVFHLMNHAFFKALLFMPCRMSKISGRWGACLLRNFAFWLRSVSVLFTSYYSFRLLFLTFLVPTNSFGRVPTLFISFYFILFFFIYLKKGL
ncbi:unnamed protein product [Spirodela intermedia]|uniref:NADH:quinone oxidoreductase/Mrp antiporter transmembrane domain-containing protein n=1 Tax=Spirodela intermedia TaxID=51605 RepID=A0A7I8IRQ3_SPIIN|nr:unnamed protein product [Spirodela intermedia]CAA6659651.1 unnamed protein product [Spirodela intermedia]